MNYFALLTGWGTEDENHPCLGKGELDAKDKVPSVSILCFLGYAVLENYYVLIETSNIWNV